MNHQQLPPPAQLMNFIIGKWISKPIYAAAEFRIADILADGPKNIEEIAQTSGTHAPTLYRMMRALASVGIFSEIEDRNFSLTPMAELLKSGAMRSIAILFNSEWSDKSWGYFLDSIKTGNTAFETAYGMPVSDWLEENPKAAMVFNEANAVKAAGSHRAVINAYDFSGIKTLTDVGGGVGALMTEILMANPHMKGITADLPSVILDAEKFIKTKNLEDRCQTAVCDFFKSIPAGSDAYLLSNILHDWPDEKCQQILKNCHQAMGAESKLLIVEMIVSPGNGPSIAKLLDLEMLVTTGGRERTEDEFKQLFEVSGFNLSSIISMDGNNYILEGIKQ